MSAGASVPAWLAALRARAASPPARPRVPLRIADAVIGSVEPGFIEQLAALRPPRGDAVLVPSGDGWVLQGEPVASLARVAGEMRRLGLAHTWRDEQLAVDDAQGRRLATVERAAVRPLGIHTHAVHLVGFAPDGRMWVQQRSLDKPNDPGLWDTLMGGMVPASDTLAQALERETWEEAGLRIGQLHQVSPGGRVTLRRPSDGDAGHGYTVENIDWFRATVPAGIEPRNQDGEVAQFALVAVDEVLRAVQRGEYTLEAALIIAAATGLG